jgi:internalin A
MIAGMDPDNKPKGRRWKTISLRGLLLLVLVIAVWLGWIVQKARQQREAVAALQKLGGFVHYDWEFVDGPVKVPRGNLIWKPTWGILTPAKRPWAPNWLRLALGDEYFQSIVHVSLYVDISKMTDASLEAIGRLTKLEELRIGGAGISDRGLAHLKGLTRLKHLSLGGGNLQISDAGLSFLKGMRELEDLDLAGWHFSDEGLAELRELKNLKTVHVGLSNEQGARRKRLQELLPRITFD